MEAEKIKKALERYANGGIGYFDENFVFQGVKLSDVLELIKEQEKEIEKLKKRRYIIAPKKVNPVEEILRMRNNPFVVAQDDIEVKPIPSEEEACEEFAEWLSQRSNNIYKGLLKEYLESKNI